MAFGREGAVVTPRTTLGRRPLPDPDPETRGHSGGRSGGGCNVYLGGGHQACAELGMTKFGAAPILKMSLLTLVPIPRLWHKNKPRQCMVVAISDGTLVGCCYFLKVGHSGTAHAERANYDA